MVELQLKDIKINEDRHKYSWKKVKENKSSYDELLHFGHCKAMLKSKLLVEFEPVMQNIPFLVEKKHIGGIIKRTRKL